ncbi:MAG: GNAT family N-acetyltransferase [Acidobacteria bacterium]|nr:GNAT family N-acetyltransferase [Acidobacteriota bacterium]
MGEVRIEHLGDDRLEEAAATLARAFVTNPIHVAAFGAGQLAVNETFFRLGLPLMRGTKLVALEDGALVGLIHWIESPGCQPTDQDRRTLAPLMLKTFGIRTAWRLRSWLTAWSGHDPQGPHVHLGPIGVEPSAQGRGIGRLLMRRYCEQLDASRQVGYLETDRPENVPFYEGFGFRVTGEMLVLGVPNFFMTRPAP